MDLSRNHYIKFLVDEVMRTSTSTVSQILYEVKNFSKTIEFEESYKKWIVVTSIRYKLNKKRRPKSMKDIIDLL